MQVGRSGGIEVKPHVSIDNSPGELYCPFLNGGKIGANVIEVMQLKGLSF